MHRTSQVGLALERVAMQPYYDHAGIQIYHADCREVLPSLPQVDLVLTDPPYGIGEARGKNKSLTKLAVAKDYGVDAWDDRPVDGTVLKLAISAGQWSIIFGGNYFELPSSSCWLVWDKINGASDFADCELAWTNLSGAVRLIRYRWAGMLQQYGGKDKEHRYHPTQKPLPVMRWCVKRAPDDVQTILDPFMGSGTTLRAAKDLGRKAIGIEIDEKYCEIAARRLAQEVLF